MPTRLIDSTPPPMVMSCWPDITSAAAKFTASRPEAQKRLIWMPGTLSPKPATSAAARAMSPPASPTGSTQPMHHVVDLRGVELVAVPDGAERLRRQIERGHFVQRAVGLAAPARGADGVVDECVGHRHSNLPRVRREPESRTSNLRWIRARALARRNDSYKLRAIKSFMISFVPA